MKEEGAEGLGDRVVARERSEGENGRPAGDECERESVYESVGIGILYVYTVAACSILRYGGAWRVVRCALEGVAL